MITVSLCMIVKNEEAVLAPDRTETTTEQRVALLNN